MPISFTINGKTYRSLDEMPLDVRRQYDNAMRLLADRDGNGVPDIMERPGGMATDPQIEAVGTSRVIVASSLMMQDGKEVASDELPADLREQLSKALADAQTADPQTPKKRTTRWTIDDATAPTDGGVQRAGQRGIYLSWSSLLHLIIVTAVLAGAAVWLLLRKWPS